MINCEKLVDSTKSLINITIYIFIIFYIISRPIREATSMDMFKALLKTFLFKTYYV